MSTFTSFVCPWQLGAVAADIAFGKRLAVANSATLTVNDNCIVIAGSGLIGLAAAAKLLQCGYRIVLTGEMPPVFSDASYEARVYALNPGSCKLLQELGVWEEIQRRRAFPYQAMHVWDQEHGGEISFTSTDLGLSALGVIAEDAVLRSALFEHLQQQAQVEICCPARIEAVDTNAALHQVTLSDGTTKKCHLLIGADGAESLVRRYMGGSWQYTDYRQTAIVAVVRHDISHQNACWQQFYQRSILAFLPLSAHHSSIVWSCDNEKARQLMRMEAAQFADCLRLALDNKLGTVQLDSRRFALPLFGGQTDCYVKRGVVLVGDAAHHIHPLAGQGANAGLADVAALAAVLSAGGIPQLSQLRRYQRAVIEYNLSSKLFMEILNCIFTGRRRLLRRAFCTYGLNTVARCQPVKAWLMRRASGISA